MHTQHLNKLLNVAAALSLVVIVMLVVHHNRGEAPPIESAYASFSQNVSGFAWSSDIGWISFNCLDSSGASSPQQNTCATADYGVNIDFVGGTGNLTGFAWSSNIGYINFNPTPDPATGCTASPCARLDLATNNVAGYARACSVLLAADCTGTAMKSDSQLAGWDGWIKLSDPSWTNPANYGYLGQPGVVYDAVGHSGIYFDPRFSLLKGFAWGGIVVGWLDFAPVVPPAVGGVFVYLPSPIVSVTPIQLDFQNVDSTTGKPLAFTIANTGEAGSYLSGDITVPAGTPFTLSDPDLGNPFITCSGSTSCAYDGIPSGGYALLNVTFTPPEIGTGQTTQVTFDSVGVPPPIVKTVFGNGVYLVSGQAGFDFGNVLVWKKKDLILTITNSGTLDLGSNDLSFPFPTYTCVSGCPFNLPPGASVNVTIRFAPTAVQTYDGNAFLTTKPSVIFPITGAGVIMTFQFKDQ